MIRFLIYSLCLVSFFSCKSYQPVADFKAKRQVIENTYFSDLEQEYIYAVTISAFKNNVSGLLVIKAIDNTKHRILLATEFGNTLLDLTITPNGYIKNYAMADLDRKIILNLLANYFFVLLNKKWESDAFYSIKDKSIYKVKIKNKKYFLSYSKGLLNTIEYVNRKKKLEIYFENVFQDSAQQIKLKHYNLDLSIDMIRI